MCVCVCVCVRVGVFMISHGQPMILYPVLYA